MNPAQVCFEGRTCVVAMRYMYHFLHHAIRLKTKSSTVACLNIGGMIHTKSIIIPSVTRRPGSAQASFQERAAQANDRHTNHQVTDTRPSHLRPSYTTSSTADIEKYTMPTTTYESLPSSVLAYKRANHLGRFDASLPSAEAQAQARSEREAEERGIKLGARCRLLSAHPIASTRGPGANTGMSTADEDDRRGTVRYLGAIPELPGIGVWVGIALDEPVGRNDGSVKGGKRYFECGASCGVFVRPERVEVGDFPVLDELGEEMEEI